MIANNLKILDEVSEVLSRISKILKVERSTLFLLNQEEEKLESLVAQGLKNIIISVPVGQGIAGICFQIQKAIIENDAQNCALFDDSFDRQLQFTTKKILCVPVFNEKGKPVGVIECLNKEALPFSDKDIKILDSFASAIALIIKNRELYFISENIKNNFSTLLEVFEVISSELDLNNLMKLILNKASLITKSERSSLFLVDADTGELWSAFAEGLDKSYCKNQKRSGSSGSEK